MDCIALHKAVQQETKSKVFVGFNSRIIGVKMGNTLYLDFTIDEKLAKQLREFLKVYKPLVIPDNEKPGRVALLLNTGVVIKFNYDYIDYYGIVLPIMFPKMYTKDAMELRPASLLARYDVKTAQEKYKEAITS